MQSTCQVCGVPISSGAKVCLYHRPRRPKKPQKIYTCPDCGCSISRGGTYCVKCARNHYHYTKKVERRNKPSADLSALSKEWLYQFIGLFYGEGTATIHKTNANTYIPVLALGMRFDESPILEDMVQKIGGSYHIEKRGDLLPMFRWQNSRLHEVLDLCNLFVEYTIIPARKAKEIAVLLEFCKWRCNQPLAVKDWTPAIEFQKRIRAIRQVKQG